MICLSTQGRQEKSITFNDVVHRAIEALDDIISYQFSIRLFHWCRHGHVSCINLP